MQRILTVFPSSLKHSHQQGVFAFFVMNMVSLVAAVLDHFFLPKIGTLLLLELALVGVSLFCQRFVTIVSAL